MVSGETTKFSGCFSFVGTHYQGNVLTSSHWDRCLGMPHTPVPVTASSDRFDQLMEKSEERRGSIDFSREIAEARAILSKANF
jgi:hypothetical protein